VSAVPAWDGRELTELLALDAAGPMGFVSRCGDANAHGRAYGGQILAQSLVAAARTVDTGRAPTMMQFLFLQGTKWDQAIRFDVTALQDGKRFSSRHVRGLQGSARWVLDAQVSFAVAMPAPEHGAPPAFAADEDPERLPSLADLPAAWGERIERTLGYSFDVKDVVDFRLADVPQGMQLDEALPRMRFWVRLRHSLPDDVVVHSAAFAYLSDWWLNYPASGAHLRSLDGGSGLYIASLNHALWLHRPLRADEWLHFDSTSPAAVSGRGLSVARIHNRRGDLVASATQECLMAPRSN
jgi:acyl-CoA thioesterase-2